MYCPKCKKVLKEGARFCPDCGTQAVEMKRCENCGKELLPGSRFCPECGHVVQRPGPSEGKKMPWREKPPERTSEDLSLSKQKEKGNNGGESPNRGRPVPQKKQVATHKYVPKKNPKVKDRDIPRTEPDPQENQVEKKALGRGVIGMIVGICFGVALILAFVVVGMMLIGDNDKEDAVQVAQEQQAESQGHVETDQGEASQEETSEDTEDTSGSQDTSDNGVVNILGDQGEGSSQGEENSQGAEVQTLQKTLQTSVQKADQQAAVTSGNQLDMQQIGNILGGSGATYGLYVLDITNGQEYDNGTGDSSLPASALIGVPILFTIAEGVHNGTISLDSQVEFHYTFENGRGSYKQEDEGRSFPVSQMLADALANSDNNALNSLMDFLTLDRINQTCHNYGFSSVDMQKKLEPGVTPQENYISAKDAAMMLNAVYQDNFTGIGKAFLEQYFKINGADAANKGMYPACGSCNLFLNLNGITDSRYNEVALVQNGDELFILSILTCNGVADTSAAAVSSAASYVVNTLKAQ